MRAQIAQQALQHQQQQQQAGGSNLMHSAPIPDHWDAWESDDKHDTVQMVLLPLPAGER